MPVEKFRGRVDHHVGAELDRTLKIRRHEGIVDHHTQPRAGG